MIYLAVICTFIQHTAQMLGLRYYGLVFDYDCTKITARDVEQPFVQYMKLFGYL